MWSEASLESLYAELAESVLDSEPGELQDIFFEGSSLERVGGAVRGCLLEEARRCQRSRLAAAHADYQREVSRMRNENYQLPPSPEGRRALLAHLFETYPQMERAFLTVQHRDFTKLSDRDVESCLQQLQDLGAYVPNESKAGEGWSRPEPEAFDSRDQQPETD